MENLIQSRNREWFLNRWARTKFLSETEAWRVSLFHCGYLSFVAWGLLRYRPYYEDYFTAVVWPGRLGFLVQSPQQFHFLMVATIIAVLIAAVRGGVWTWLALLTFSLTELNISPLLKPYTTNISFFILLILAFSDPPSFSPRFSMRKTSAWPLTASYFYLSLTYLSTGLSKLSADFMGWISGEALRDHLWKNYVLAGSDLSLRLYDSPLLLQILSPSIILFETGFILGFFVPRARKPLLIAGLFFHAAILIVLKINFFDFYVPVYLAAALLADTRRTAFSSG